MEVWKPVKGFEELYDVSSLGAVRSKRTLRDGKPLVMAQKTDKYGYKAIKLSCNGKAKHITIHKLVAEAFLYPYSGEQVNHIDGNKTNNCVNNLEWCTGLENMRHGRRLGLFEKARLASVNRRVSCICIQKDSGYIIECESLTHAGLWLGVSASQVCEVLHKHRKHVRNYAVI